MKGQKIIKKIAKNKQNTLKKVWFFLSQYKLYFTLIMGLAILVGLLEALNVALMYPILNLSILGESAVDNPIIDLLEPIVKILPIDDALVRYCITFLGVAIFVFLTKTIYFYLSAKFNAKIVKEAKQKIFKKCTEADYQFFVDHKQGEILYRVATAPNSLLAILNILTNISIELFLSISVLAVLLSMSWKLLIVVAIGGLIYYYLIKYLSLAVSYKAGKKKRESGEKERVIVSEYTSGIKQIRVFETFSYWEKMFNRALDTFWFHHRKSYFWSRMPEILLWLVLYLSIGVIIVIIKLQYPGEFMNLVPLVATFAFGVFLIIPKISLFGTYRMKFMANLPDLESIHGLLQDRSYTKMINGDKEFKGLKKGIHLKNVTFSHKERDILLDNINLEIKKDQTTALVGPSGSGKSTIVSLILRLFNVDKGGVYIDDVNISEYEIFSFLEKVGFVSQDTFIFNGSIKENISFGNEYTDQEINEAAELANADEFIRKLPEGYDTLVGDRGLRLSGGEQQRIAIARAVIRKPEILILDEATSSLDYLSENIVQKAIDKVAKKCTTFVIAHRLSTIQNADTINVLYDGKIVESGTHKELLAKKGKYWELYNIQKDKGE